MGLRTLYLQSLLSCNGRHALAGRVLYDRFRDLSEEAILGHLVYTDEAADQVKDPQVKSDVIGASLLHQLLPNVAFVEGGLFADNNGTWKFPREMAAQFCESGGVLIVADVDANELNHKKSHYWEAGGFFKAAANYPHPDDEQPVYGSDQTRFWRGYRQILCDPAKMDISRWLRPIYDDVPEILVGLPICLGHWESLAATCNNDTTGTLHRDLWEDRIHSCPFAAVAQIGAGFAVLIAGLVSGDGWLEGCPHNSRWLTNLASFLVDTANAEIVRRRSHRRSPHLLFLSHRSLDKPIVSPIAAAIKRQGVNLWLDAEELIPSQSLTGEISRALGEMTHFVLFWSANCLDAPWIERELNSAVALLIERRIPLIIVRLDNTPVPQIVADLYRIEVAGDSEGVIAARIAEAVSRLSKSTPV